MKTWFDAVSFLRGLSFREREICKILEEVRSSHRHEELSVEECLVEKFASFFSHVDLRPPLNLNVLPTSASSSLLKAVLYKSLSSFPVERQRNIYTDQETQLRKDLGEGFIKAFRLYINPKTQKTADFSVLYHKQNFGSLPMSFQNSQTQFSFKGKTLLLLDEAAAVTKEELPESFSYHMVLSVHPMSTFAMRLRTAVELSAPISYLVVKNEAFISSLLNAEAACTALLYDSLEEVDNAA